MSANPNSTQLSKIFKDSFSKFPIPDRGESGPDQLYRLVGEALTIFELADGHLCDLYTVVSQPNSYSIISKNAISALSSSSNRRAMLYSSLKLFFRFFPNAELSHFLEEVLKAHNLASERRNDLAHGIVATHAWKGRLAVGEFYVGPNFYNINKRGEQMKPSYLYNAAQLSSYLNGLKILDNALVRAQYQIENHFNKSPNNERYR